MNVESLHTNFVWISFSNPAFSLDNFVQVCAKENIKISNINGRVRLTLHYYVTREAVGKFLDLCKAHVTA